MEALARLRVEMEVWRRPMLIQEAVASCCWKRGMAAGWGLLGGVVVRRSLCRPLRQVPHRKTSPRVSFVSLGGTE